MRYPSAPDSPNFEETGPIRVAMRAPDPSYPDRARIDSDVRYLLRPPSTPWITFDKEPKEETHFPPETSSITAPPPVEPSNVVVAADIRPAEPSLFDTTHDEPHLPPVAHPRRIMIAVGATLGLAAMMIATVIALGSRTTAAPAEKTAAQPAATTAETAPRAVVSDKPMPPPPTTATESRTKDGWAKLTIKGPAKGHRVYLDGKMLLGKGERSFTVRCGEHTIAIGKRAEASNVDFPCNGEYVVSK